MCYDWLYWKSKTETAEKLEQPEIVAKYRYRQADIQPGLFPTPRKPEKVETELEPV
jgi:hypothetical protein